MNVNVISLYRSGSSYLMFCLEKLLQARNPNYHPAVEFFENSTKKFPPYITKKHNPLPKTYEERLSLYKELSVDENGWIFKIFPHHMQSMEDFDVIMKSENTYNIFLYRENLYDQLMSKILMNHTGISNTKLDHPINTIQNLNIDISDIQTQSKVLAKHISTQRKIFETYEFDAVLRYEDFSGKPKVDFKEYLNGGEDRIERCHKKLFTYEFKKSILPFEDIKRILDIELDKVGASPKNTYITKELDLFIDSKKNFIKKPKTVGIPNFSYYI